MKAIVIAALSMITTAAFAVEITPAHRASPVDITGIETTVTGPWGQTEVKVTATFGNDCFVPTADELVIMTRYADGFGTLDLSLGTISDRACPLNFSPVSVTINLGTYTRPNDGTFDKIIVNGVESVTAVQ